MTNLDFKAIAQDFINGLRTHPKDPALALCVAPKGYPSAWRECSEEDIERALRWALREHDPKKDNPPVNDFLNW